MKCRAHLTNFEGTAFGVVTNEIIIIIKIITIIIIIIAEISLALFQRDISLD